MLKIVDEGLQVNLMRVLTMFFLASLAFGQSDQAVTQSFTLGDIGLVAGKIYACGQIEGSRKAIAALRPEKESMFRSLWKEADCDTVVKLLETLKQL